MSTHRVVISALAIGAILTTSAVNAQTRDRQASPSPRIDQRFEQTAPRVPAQVPEPPAEDFYYRRPVMRLFQDYTLPAGTITREVFGVLADVRIEGTVRGDVSVTMGNATITSKAVIEGSLVVVGGSARIEQGADVRREVVVIGGTLDAPPGFVAGGEHVVIGTPAIGDRLSDLKPWLLRGLLFGRLIVPDLGWVWIVVAASFFFGLFFNHVFASQVGAIADTVGRRPVGSLLVGFLVFLLAGPAVAVVAVTVIGLPFAVAAFIAAAVLGKLGVTRLIGRSVIGESNSTSRAQAARSYVIGAIIVTIAYMVPLLGLFAWSMIGLFGLGAATMTFMTSLRRERPAAPEGAVDSTGPLPPVPPTPEPPVPPVPAPQVPPAATAQSFAAPPPVATGFTASSFEPPPAAPTETVVPPFVPPAPVMAAVPSDLASYPRATFLDRMAALALDCLLVAIAYNVVFENLWMFHFGGGGGSFLTVLFLYHVGFWTWKGTTLGGIICNVRILRTTGEDPRFIDALVRGLSGIFSVAALGIGCFWMLTDPERQMWHDKIAGTIVVKAPRQLILQ